jgi:hypothetical protein
MQKGNKEKGDNMRMETGWGEGWKAETLITTKKNHVKSEGVYTICQKIAADHDILRGLNQLALH